MALCREIREIANREVFWLAVFFDGNVIVISYLSAFAKRLIHGRIGHGDDAVGHGALLIGQTEKNRGPLAFENTK